MRRPRRQADNLSLGERMSRTAVPDFGQRQSPDWRGKRDKRGTKEGQKGSGKKEVRNLFLP